MKKKINILIGTLNQKYAAFEVTKNENQRQI